MFNIRGQGPIVEDLLLLMFDDTSGTIAGEGTLYYTLGGAVLVELGVGKYVRVDENDQGLNGLKVHAVAGDPPADPLLRGAYQKVADRKRGVQTLLIEIGTELRETVLERLVERGMLRQETKKTLGLFRTTALIGLLLASGTLPNLHRSIPWSGKVYKRAKELEKGSWGAEAVNTAVMRTVAATSMGTAIAATS
ncbi:GPP34 family phosphoprotein [Streptomyces sp. S4.7]|uniref:GOLPH3/VPS74 family protein n=1 Tax=Streptomyces sp. S4.7 TaxID=2705439 RepID=UPI001EF3A2D9|nr:GPP34 family phosphoprotein [Streptomyces sp. S4.7]